MLLATNPELYNAVYNQEPDFFEEYDEEEFEQVVPETEADVQRILADLKSLGFSG